MTGFVSPSAVRRNFIPFSPISPPWAKSSAELAVGGYGGPSEIMNLVAPLGPVYQPERSPGIR